MIRQRGISQRITTKTNIPFGSGSKVSSPTVPQYKQIKHPLNYGQYHKKIINGLLNSIQLKQKIFLCSNECTHMYIYTHIHMFLQTCIHTYWKTNYVFRWVDCFVPMRHEIFKRNIWGRLGHPPSSFTRRIKGK